MQELRVAWITDLDAVTSIVNSADIAPFVLEGEAFSAPPVSDFLKYLGVYDGTTLVGVYLFMGGRFLCRFSVFPIVGIF